MTFTFSENSESVIGNWKFDLVVAERFFQEAINNIPDYLKVNDLTVDILSKKLPKDALIIDVGSALGFTVSKLISAGFDQTYGVDSSEEMIKKSAFQNRIFRSDKLPEIQSKWDAVIMNWTLHFIHDRHQYLCDVYNKMSDGGILILTDKMDGTSEEHQDYIGFKLKNGMSLSEIESKAKAITGVLITLPITWYLDTLSKIGFKNIEIKNKRFMFHTLLCQK